MAIRIGAAALVPFMFAVACQSPKEDMGPWVSTGQMAYQHNGSAAVALSSGKVMIAGGLDGNHRPTWWLDAAELYDPATGTWAPTGSMAKEREVNWLLVLPTGRVLVAGGTTSGSYTIKAAELYEPATGLWVPTESMVESRGFGHAAASLPSGKVLVAGGMNQDAEEGLSWGDLSSAELYDPDAGTWSATGSMAVVRVGHRLEVLRNGKVLAAGGSLGASAELYDPVTGNWTPTGSMTTPRINFSMTLLASGKVLAAGGFTDVPGEMLSTAELYDPASATWTPTGSAAHARAMHSATLLHSGRVLISGGGSTAELYDPASGQWTGAGSTAFQWGFNTATLLPSGQVLVAGGQSTSAELYVP